VEAAVHTIQTTAGEGETKAHSEKGAESNKITRI
jgi:hypothetical protein